MLSARGTGTQKFQRQNPTRFSKSPLTLLEAMCRTQARTRSGPPRGRSCLWWPQSCLSPPPWYCRKSPAWAHRRSIQTRGSNRPGNSRCSAAGMPSQTVFCCGTTGRRTGSTPVSRHPPSLWSHPSQSAPPLPA